MHLNRVILFCIGLSLQYTSLCAQEKYYAEIQLYTTEQGLPSNHVYQCFQDRRGLLWLLTGAGLCSFDGQQFKLLLNSGFNLDFSKNRIVFEEPNGDLWIRNYVKKDSIRYQIVNTISGKITTLQEKFGTILPTQLMDVQYAGHQEYWVTTFKGEIFKFKTGKAPQRIANYPGIPPAIFAADSLSQTVVLDLTNNQSRTLKCCLLNEKGKEIEQYSIPYLQNILVDRQGTYRFYSLNNFGTISSTGVLMQEPIQRYLNTYQGRTSYDGAIPLAYDPATQYHWLIHDDQLQVFNQKNGSLNLFSNGNYLPTNAFSIFIDRQSIAWFCTIEGLYKVKLKPQRFQRLLWLDPRKAKNPVLMSCRGILKDEQAGVLYVNASNSFWSVKDGKVEKLFSRVIGIYGMAQLKDQSLMLGCENLYRYFPTQNQTLDLGRIDRDYTIAWSFLPQSKRIWVGLNNGLAYLDSSLSPLHFVSPKLSHPVLDNAITHLILPAGQQRLWLLTEKGLFLFHPQKGILARYWTGGKGKFKLPVENLRACYQEKKDRWWFATAEGLLRWNPLTGESRLFTTRTGLSNNNIYAVYPDAYGFLWMSSDNGIMQFQKNTAKTRFFLPEDGISHREFNRISHFQDQEGWIYFGSLNGVTVFHPRNFYHDFDLNPNIPIILTRAQLFSRRSNTLQDAEPAYLAQGKISFKPSDLYLTLRFGLLDYTATKSVHYEYRIEGLSNHWAVCPGGVLQLAGLPYGNYQIRVRAKTDSGQYSQQQLLLPIQVLRPFYVQYWFLALLLSLIVAGIVGFFRYRNQRLKQHKKELEQEVKLQTEKIRRDKETIEAQAAQLIKLDEAKTRFFANITHELRTPLTLILGPLQTYLETQQLQVENAEFLYLAKHHTERLLQMVNDLLDLSKLEAGKLSLQEAPVLLLQKIEYLLSSFEALAASKNIKLKLDYEARPELVLRLDRRLLRMIITNLLSNALKFTEAGGQVSLKVKELKNEVQIEVSDTGRGIHPDDLPEVFERYFQTRHQENAYEGGTGIGLALARESSKALGGTLEVSSVWGKGSTFTLYFPKNEMASQSQDFHVNDEANVHLPPILNQNQTAILSSAANPEGKANLLIVEDHPDLRRYLTQILSKEYHVVALENGAQAREYLEKETPPDLIISDIMMPVMDGFQLLEWLKNSVLAHLPVIMLTARGDLGDKLRALQIGVDDYLVKPFVEEELVTRIQNLLRRQELRRSLTPLPEAEASTDLQLAAVGSTEKEWLATLEQTVLSQLANPDFSVNDLAKSAFMSRSVFYSEMGRVLGLTPNEYINEIRLLKAMELFQNNPGIYSVKEMASKVGYRDEKYFSRQFKQRFGVLPSQLR